MDFNVILSEVLKEKGMRQRDLAALMGVTEVTVSNWARGTASPSVTQVDRIAAALDIPPAALLTDSAALRELIYDIDGQEDAIQALLALLARIRVDDGSMLSVLRDLTDVLGKLQNE